MTEEGPDHHRSGHRRSGRPSPDALLRQAAREGRGRLKIFLGAAPGVGKTFEMLQTAQAKRRDGIDIAVGVVEPHGRRETEALERNGLVENAEVAMRNNAGNPFWAPASMAGRGYAFVAPVAF